MLYSKSIFISALSVLALESSLLATENTFVLIALDDIIVPIPLTTSNPTPSITATQQAYLDAINQARSQSQDCGVHGIMPPVPALTWNDKLYQAAKIHSNDMAQSNTFSHTGSGTSSDIVAQLNHPGTGSNFQERIEYAGYNWSNIGENIAAGYPTLQSVIAAWLDSDGHCFNMMQSIFTEVGMAEIVKSGSQYTYYWTQDFGSPQ